jgi:hypothetical protein
MKQIIFNNPYNKKNQFLTISNEMPPQNVILCMQQDIEKVYNDPPIIYTYTDELKKEYEKEIKKKLNSYKSQDKQKNKFDKEKMITYNQIIKKLYDCQLKCYYCECNVVILFNKKRESIQWTLERLDNNIGHYESNTCISCLKCNLQRRTDNYEYFKNGKQLKINIIK